jgi:hypothetical protein
MPSQNRSAHDSFRVDVHVDAENADDCVQEFVISNQTSRAAELAKQGSDFGQPSETSSRERLADCRLRQR